LSLSAQNQSSGGRKRIFLEKVSSKEWKLTKFLESLEWEETILESLEKAGFKTFFESPERKESLRANGFRFLMPFFCSRQVQSLLTLRYFFNQRRETVNWRLPNACSQNDDKQDEKYQKERNSTTLTKPGTGKTSASNTETHLNLLLFL
jgi:hypothetical protein